MLEFIALLVPLPNEKKLFTFCLWPYELRPGEAACITAYFCETLPIWFEAVRTLLSLETGLVAPNPCPTPDTALVKLLFSGPGDPILDYLPPPIARIYILRSFILPIIAF